jgi:GR25 family glycosyltransferase involved in LPS biosynthesis
VTAGFARRHASDFWRVHHDHFESDARWDRVEQIYVVNMPVRKDRWDSITRELASAGAPFDRITKIDGAAGTLSPMQSLRHRLCRVAAPGRCNSLRQISGMIGCADSHLTAMRDVVAKGYQNVVVLEDDFVFTPEIPSHLDDLKAFLDRESSYKICLLSTSKYGRLEELDELVLRTRQECTNTGAYCVSRNGATELIAIWEEARELLRRTGESIYAVDRYWKRLQRGNDFVVFRNKFGFQQSGFSTIEHNATRYLD